MPECGVTGGTTTPMIARRRGDGQPWDVAEASVGVADESPQLVRVAQAGHEQLFVAA